MSHDSRLLFETAETVVTVFTTGHFSTKLSLVYVGGEATVYSTDSDLHGKLCVKVFSRPTLEDVQEIKTLIQLACHVNIVRFLGLFKDELSSGYVMEYMSHGSLHDVIHNKSIKYDDRQVYSWILQASRGMSYLHGHKVLHRDIKPRNFLLGETIDILKIGDFGIAKLNAMGKTQTSFNGTTMYMAPEVISSDGVKYEISADVYSFVISIWEMFHRKAPFYEYEEMSSYDRSKNIVENRIRPQIEIILEEKMKQLISRGWDNDPENRPLITEFLVTAKTPPINPQELFCTSTGSVENDEKQIEQISKTLQECAIAGTSSSTPTQEPNEFENTSPRLMKTIDSDAMLRLNTSEMTTNGIHNHSFGRPSQEVEESSTNSSLGFQRGTSWNEEPSTSRSIQALGNRRSLEESSAAQSSSGRSFETGENLRTCLILSEKSIINTTPSVPLVDKYFQKAPKDTDRIWRFSFPKRVAGIVLGSSQTNKLRYLQESNVTLTVLSSVGFDPVSFKVDGTQTTFENVYEVCLDIWKRLATHKTCFQHHLNGTETMKVENLNMTKFQQLLFMEDYQVYIRQKGPSWKVRSFYERGLNDALTILRRIRGFRQITPHN